MDRGRSGTFLALERQNERLPVLPRAFQLSRVDLVLLSMNAFAILRNFGFMLGFARNLFGLLGPLLFRPTLQLSLPDPFTSFRTDLAAAAFAFGAFSFRAWLWTTLFVGPLFRGPTGQDSFELGS